ncbi:hypothetical protein VF04_36760 [Nostoc linckia z7]|uniref:HNH endonuclease n=1 Tax=Nostoc linckia z7 TaxID=1628745 RepID=A0ABX4KD57_NOSLI|nr:hypothetical protein VF05_32415 [Nostoc linckia z3]PHJ63623.1 hypothetical protein VF03_29925 [Nostoc linckia z2]PHJ70427.1 hypothetical protein VF06_37620 [Nostoc linckia z4]PHJ83483.1 hypothetical protein VF04_36760 [Nostoc linckia z7]
MSEYFDVDKTFSCYRETNYFVRQPKKRNRPSKVPGSKVVEQLKDGKIIAEHKSIRDAAVSINANPDTLSKRIRSTGEMYGFQWRYKSEL